MKINGFQKYEIALLKRMLVLNPIKIGISFHVEMDKFSLGLVGGKFRKVESRFSLNRLIYVSYSLQHVRGAYRH